MDAAVPQITTPNSFILRPDKEIHKLQHQYHTLAANGILHGLTIQHDRQYRDIRSNLNDKYIDIAERNWTNKLDLIVQN